MLGAENLHAFQTKLEQTHFRANFKTYSSANEQRGDGKSWRPLLCLSLDSCSFQIMAMDSPTLAYGCRYLRVNNVLFIIHEASITFKNLAWYKPRSIAQAKASFTCKEEHPANHRPVNHTSIPRRLWSKSSWKLLPSHKGGDWEFTKGKFFLTNLIISYKMLNDFTD